MSDITPRPPGRPTLFEPDHCDKLLVHMSQGLSFESFAAVIGVHRDTLYEWANVHPEFSDAKERGTDLARLWWEKAGISGLFSESWHLGGSKALNSAVWIFNMKNRFSWRDKQPDEDGPAAVVNNLTITDEQLAKMIKAARGEG